MNPAEED